MHAMPNLPPTALFNLLWTVTIVFGQYIVPHVNEVKSVDMSNSFPFIYPDIVDPLLPADGWIFS